MPPKKSKKPTTDSDEALFYVRLARKDAASAFRSVAVALTLEEIRNSVRESKLSDRLSAQPENVPDDDGRKEALPSSSKRFAEAVADFSKATFSFILAADLFIMMSGALTSAHMSSVLPRELEKVAAHIKSRPTYVYYGIPREHFDVMSRFDLNFESSARFSRQFPGMLLSALIAQYDAFLATLVEAICYAKPEILTGSERHVGLAELSSFSTLDDARRYIVEQESEHIMRDSHEAQLQWFERKCNVNVKNHVDRYKTFLEICERRNLIVHTDGRVSSTYLSNCARLGIETGDLSTGAILRVTPSYYRSAVSVVFEIGFKLAMTCWEKYAPEGRADAESALIEASFEFIKLEKYKLAARILEYFVKYKKDWAEERSRLICIVNYANAVKLAGDKDKALEILSDLDWSAVSREFRICVAAVRDDAAECALHMSALGKDEQMTRNAYMSWPVFKGVRDAPEFIDTYNAIYGKAPVPNAIGKVDHDKQ